MGPTLIRSPEAQAERWVKANARQKRFDQAAAQAWAQLDPKRQACINRCVEMEGRTLTEVTRREEHQALASCINALMAKERPT